MPSLTMCFLAFLGSNFHHSLSSSPFCSCLQSHLWYLAVFSTVWHLLYSCQITWFPFFTSWTLLLWIPLELHSLVTVLLYVPLPCFNITLLSPICFLILWEMINVVTTIDRLEGFPGIAF